MNVQVNPTVQMDAVSALPAVSYIPLLKDSAPPSSPRQLMFLGPTDVQA